MAPVFYFFFWFLVHDREACLFNRGRRGEKMSPFIPFSQRTIASSDYDGLLQLHVHIQ